MMAGTEATREPRSELRQRLKWSFFLRLVIVSTVTGLLLLFLQVGPGHPSEQATWWGVLVATGYLHAALGLAFVPRVNRVVFLCCATIVFDLAWVSICLLLTGGFQSPFPFLYNLVILNGSVLLLRRGAFATALLAALSYAVVGFVSPGSIDARGLFLSLVNVCSFFWIALLGGYLARSMAEAHRLLEKQSEEYGKLISLKDTLVQNLDCGVAMVDLKGQVSFINRAAMEMIGIGAHEAAGLSLDKAIPELARDMRSEGVSAGRAPKSGEIGVTKGGIRRTMAYSILPLLGHPGSGLDNLLIFQDVTEVRLKEQERKREEELKKLREWGNRAGDSEFGEIIGQGPVMEKVFLLIRKTARVSSNVLVTGESGTGKELVARAIHTHSTRGSQRFIAVNCGAIPENLIESELFGHVKGAFTGAVVDRAGIFVEANGGTIFLDEVGELPLHLQVKFLRVLQERTVTPIGGNRSAKVDVRVISSTNRDLLMEVRKGRFREDLYFRLNVIHIVLPPLRERRQDIPLLVHRFIRRYSAGRALEISPKALGLLMDYSYPGNVRELENIIEHACAMASSSEIRVEELSDTVVNPTTMVNGDQPRLSGETKPPGGVLTQNLHGSDRRPDEKTRTLIEIEREHIRNVLELTGWRIRGPNGAAVMLGLKPTTLTSRLKSLGIRRPSPPVFRRSDDISSA